MSTDEQPGSIAQTTQEVPDCVHPTPSAPRPSTELSRTLKLFEAELQVELDAATQLSAEVTWFKMARQVLCKAREASGHGDAQAAWSYIRLARRLELFGLAPEARQARALRLSAQAQAIGREWRREAIRALLDRRSQLMRNEADIGASHVPDFLLAEATLVFDEYVQNTFYKVSLLQSHLKLISLVSTIVSIIILLFVGIVPALKLFGWVPAKDLVPFDFNVSPAFLALAACFGVLGAAVSAILSSKLDISATIPEGISTPVLALGRAAVGAPAAILIVLLLQTPLLTIADSSKSDLPLLLVASFAAGFSERLVLRAVESVSGGSSGGAT